MKISPTLIVLLVELTIALLVIIGVAAFIVLRRRRQENVVLNMVEKNRMSSEPVRHDELLAALREALKDEDDEIKIKAEQIIESERIFHKRVIDAFRARDREAIVKLDEWTKELAAPYRSLISAVVGSSEKEMQEITEKLGEMEEAMAALASERDRMIEELRKKDQEVDSMVSEYVSTGRGKEPRSDVDEPADPSVDNADGEGSGPAPAASEVASGEAGKVEDDQFLDKDIEAFLEREEAGTKKTRASAEGVSKSIDAKSAPQAPESSGKIEAKK